MYYLIYGLVYGLSLLPMRILYFLSDILFFVLYYLTGYRRRVVMTNLNLAFPEQSPASRKKIARSFYRNLTDSFSETIKLFSAGESFIRRHFLMETPELYERFFAQGRRCQVHLGHLFNWEFANIGMPFFTSQPFIVVYMPLSNRIFDRLFLRLRKRAGSILLPATEMRRSILPYRNSLYLLTLVADQAPGNPAGSFWLSFFGQPTPFLRAPERGARAGDIPVLFGYIYKPRRGHYRAVLELAAEHPAELPEGELTRRYVRFLEDVIRKHPELYLWSHRRWKYPWAEEYGKMWIDSGEAIPLNKAVPYP